MAVALPPDSPRAFQCTDVERFSDAYLDGEFEASERACLEGHLEGCPRCCRALQQLSALRGLLLRARLGVAGEASAELRERIRLDLGLVDRERREAATWLPAWLSAPNAEDPRRNWQRIVVPLLMGASAAGALAVVYAVVVPLRADRWEVRDAVEVHARALPLEIATGELDKLMPLFDRHLGFQVHPPAFQQGLLLEGGRLWRLGGHDAAYLQYDGPNHAGRISLFIVEDPEAAVRLIGARRTMLNNREVFLTQARGRSVVVWRNQDIVYSLVSDLGEEETLSLLGRR